MGPARHHVRVTEPPDRPRRLLVAVAHPDDETFGAGSLIAHEAQAGVEVTVLCATRGEAGQPPDWLTPDQDLGEVRAAELHRAADVLGAARVVLLDFADSDMTGDMPAGALAAVALDDVVAQVRDVLADVGPDCVVTLDPTNGDGHRDHVRMGEATISACADQPDLPVYIWSLPRPLLQRWFDELARSRPDAGHLALDLDVAGVGRTENDVTTVLDTAPLADVRRRAVAEHASQKPPFADMPDELTDEFLSRDVLVRVQPAWTGGSRETGLRYR